MLHLLVLTTPAPASPESRRGKRWWLENDSDLPGRFSTRTGDPDRTSAHSEQAWLRRVRVRLIEESERPSFDQLLEKHHYLHNRRPGGRSLRYVAELDGQWVALLSFSGAAPRVKAGDRKIGRTARQRVRRLHFVVNNSRFLVLLDRGRHPNLASRVPGLCLKRLSRDGQARR